MLSKATEHKRKLRSHLYCATLFTARSPALLTCHRAGGNDDDDGTVLGEEGTVATDESSLRDSTGVEDSSLEDTCFTGLDVRV